MLKFTLKAFLKLGVAVGAIWTAFVFMVRTKPEDVVAGVAQWLSFGRSHVPEWLYSPLVGNLARWTAIGLLAALALRMTWLIGLQVYRAWWARPAAFLPFRDTAVRLYERTRAADVLSDAGLPVSPAAALGYHAYQLVHYAKFGKATLYGRKTSSTVMEPIPQRDLWTGKRADDMHSWISENGVEYADLSLRRSDLRRIARQVKRAVKDHNALLARTTLRSPDNAG